MEIKECAMCGRQLNCNITGLTVIEIQHVKIYKVKFSYPHGDPETYHLCADCTLKVKGMMEHGKSNYNAMDY